MAQDRRRFLGMAGAAIGAGVAGAVTGPASAAQAGTAQATGQTSAGQAGAARASGTHRRRLYFGTYGGGVGIAELDPATGLPTIVGAAATTDPSFLALSPDRDTLYASNEVEAGTVTAFALRRGTAPRLLGAGATGGVHPVFVHAHPNGRHVLTADYTSGTVSVLPVRRDGSLGPVTGIARHTGSGPDPDRQRGPHPHKVLTDPAGRFVHAVDLGADAVFSYRLRGGDLVPIGRVAVRPGAGPRHLAFHPSGRVAYLANELDATLTVLAYDTRSGRLRPGQTLATAPPGAVRNFPGEVIVSADGRFVYVSNRGPNTIAILAVAGNRVVHRGTVDCGGDFPRHIALSPDGRFLYVANQRSGDIATLRVDRHTGSLTPAGAPLPAGTPVMVLPA